MSRYRLNVVLSQAQGRNPAKRALEESLAAALLMEPGLDLSIVPYLYDLDADHTGRLFLESVQGDMVVLGWMYPRAAFWLLDRDGIKGHFGESQLKPPAADDEDEDREPEPPQGIGSLNVPDRTIYCLDLRDFDNHKAYVEEVQRIAAECRGRHAAKEAEAARAKLIPVELGLARAGVAPAPTPSFAPEQLLAQPDRRWYPVIDYSRCTNCMECIDFCLFGVYGVDNQDRILVDNQDNCKRGCPACSRVCPEQAIIFPDYKTPAIAGAPVGGISGLKIDLTKLFGGGDAIAIAAQERDHELVRDGREAVGLSVGIPKRQVNKDQQPKDEMDDLMDSLDAMDL
ncbi:MAG TPA: ferredoxin family protein [Gemmataceae bacterium]|nr:ferredoxin family protein [Gemmataceae bacterium]